ncbi:MAG: di-heme-cytochrome C peroxidase, partial [Allosphingosinicella sp.]
MVGVRLRAALLAASVGLCAAGMAAAQSGAPVYLDQGADWTQSRRIQFYTQDQGSQIMPLLWLRALKLPDGSPFLAGNLARYGYLPNPASAAGLPVGFTSATFGGREFAGMTCAACHTREIAVADKSYRVDGGPAISDFGGFLIDLDAAVGRVLNDNTAFHDFAVAVLGGDASNPAKVKALKQELSVYHQREHAIVSRSLPRSDLWGLGRLDAVSMIFNRLAGLDIGPPPTYLIPGNIVAASSPVRYPFLWNAPRQDFTQWPGFAPNGNAILGLARNSGEVFGVFATFHPRKDAFGLADFHTNNSANYRGLNAVEDLLWKIGPPKWPFAVNAGLAAQGAPLYQQHCAACHGEKEWEMRSLLYKTWA